jgi:hypothetical protein
MRIILNEAEIKKIVLEKFPNMVTAHFMRSESGKLELDLQSCPDNLSGQSFRTMNYVRENFPVLLEREVISESLIKKMFMEFGPASAMKIQNIKRFRELVPDASLLEAKKISEFIMDLKNA